MMNAENGVEIHPMELLLTGDLYWPKVGELKTGLVVQSKKNEVLVDIGSKSEGIIDVRELSSLDDAAKEDLAEGNDVLVYVLNPEDKNGNLILSYLKAVEEKDWLNVAQLMEKQELCEGIVVGFNRGGVLVGIGQIRGFVPNSQLNRERNINRLDQPDKQRALQALVGQPLSAKIVEVDRERNRLIMSEQAAYKEIREAKRAQKLAEIEKGTECEGRVVNIANFGAFVDIGGVEGLVHLSELSWKRVNHPSELLKVGDTVNVSIINIDMERQRVALSIKRLQPDPWTLINDYYHVGQLLEAKITRLTKFGAFARLVDEYQLEGLIHVSELAQERIEHPKEIVQVSDTVTVRVIRIDAEQRQLGLSIKQVSSDKYMEADLAMLDSSAA